MRADSGRQHRQVLVVPLHPGDGEDGRHHADHAAEQVEIRRLMGQVVPPHHRHDLGDALARF